MVAQYRDKRKGKGQWWFRFYRDGRRHEQHGFQNQTDAQDAEVRRRRELDGSTPKIRTDTDFLTALNRYTDHCEKATTRQHTLWIRYRAKKYFNPLFKVRCMDMDHSFMRKAMREWDRLGTRKTTNRNLGLVKQILNFAESEELIPYNPIRKFRYLPEERTDPYVPPAEDVLAVRMLAGPMVKQMVDLVTKSGIRKGEMLGIRRQDVDLSRRTFTVYNRKKRGGHLTPRTLAITDDLSANFEYLVGRAKGKWLWVDDKGARYTRMGMTLPYLCDRAGVDRFNWHSLRHFASHLMLSRGASLEQVARQLGHDRMTTTDRYARKLRGPDLDTARFLEKPLKTEKKRGNSL